DNNYHFQLQVNWTETLDAPSVLEESKTLKIDNAKQLVSKYAHFELPKRLWQSLVAGSSISATTKWADLNKQQLQDLAIQLTAGVFQITGKSTFKEEFVTAGGVDLKEIDFKTFQSKIHPRLYLAGEVLNIDAVTGGFNFQNCWTGGFLVAQAITEAMKNN
ncbi:MAG TPA: NAD(P)/FAD-dependent oxidoreductase, partial [Flavobacteriaceae bacterium]|nr:NAD(P)/FAD-dependent oxidoreductase [Flavobacteriaceae bacterium]